MSRHPVTANAFVIPKAFVIPAKAFVIPAKAGIQKVSQSFRAPAFAGMTMLALTLPTFAATQADCDAAESQSTLAPAAYTATDARAYWLDAKTLQWPGAPANGRYRLYRAKDHIALLPFKGTLTKDTATRFAFIGDGPRFQLPSGVDARALLRDELLLVRESDDGRVLDSTRLQIPGALDALYAEAAQDIRFGAPVTPDIDEFNVWAPTARNVALCTYATPTGPSIAIEAMTRDDKRGSWSVSADLQTVQGRYYAYLVDVFVPGTGWVRNRVTDPYSVALAANGTRSLVAGLDAPALKPDGWATTPRQRIDHTTDLGIYELHVRDFSLRDMTVPADHRGKYLAFTDRGSNGMRHLRALANAGITDVHLLPVFDFATVPERGCNPAGNAREDCFNWGYDPAHFNAPEGSYATDPDGTARILEFRRMVQALHASGLRVGMDVVYNHTMAAGQAPGSVLDRIVPGYYHRLDAKGAVETSTCCANTATEHRMMAKLMRDSLVLWATQYNIDSFRFDLMGHQPRAAMEDLQRALRDATGRDIPLIGEGWNFGEVANGVRFVQAAQGKLDGTHIGTFSDRARDAVRGGGPGDHIPALVDAKGWSNGANDPHTADLVRVGLAGTLRDYTLPGAKPTPLSAVDYKGQPAGYATAPDEVVNYVENHDNQTLFDIGVMKLPRTTTPTERAQVQLIAAATVAFSQGIAYWHAGIDVLRSKSLDRNSFDSGDAFNALDWTYTDNGFGEGLPPAADNREDWPAMQPLLAGAAHIRPAPSDIAWMRDAFQDLLRIRASTPLFRMRNAEDIEARLTFPATGDARVIVGRIDGEAFPDANFGGVQYFLNADTQAHTLTLAQSRGEAWTLHPVHAAQTATDKRARDAQFDRDTGRFTIPARTAVVFVLPQDPQALPPLITTTLPATLAAPEDLRIDIQLPPGYDAHSDARYPVLYLDDGQDLEAVRVRESLARGDVDGTLRPLILVAMHMPKDRMGAYGLSDRATGRSVIAPTKYGAVGSQAQAYSNWVATSLVPWIDAHYRTRATPQDRTVLGWSLGGLNAFNLAWQYPEVFGRFGAFSPSFWLSAESQDAQAVQRTRLAQQMVETGAPHPTLRAFFAVGTEEETDDRDGDGVIDVLDDTRDMMAALADKGVTFDADALYILPGGHHRQASWAKMFPVFLRWAYPSETPAQ